MVRAESGDAVPSLHPERAKPVGKAPHTLRKLSVGPRLLTRDDRDTARRHPRSPFDPRTNTPILHRCHSSPGARGWTGAGEHLKPIADLTGPSSYPAASPQVEDLPDTFNRHG